MKPYWLGPDSTFYVGDVLEVLCSLPAGSVNCVVTSPPYWSLRDYGIEPSDWGNGPFTLGLEPLHDCWGFTRGKNCSHCYLCHMRTVAAAIWRVLRDDGVMFINIADSYAANRSYQVTDNKHTDVGNNGSANVPAGLKPKDRCGIPERLRLAFQADGWYWRDTITLCKTAPMPESVRDRTTQATEDLIVFSKRERYFWGQEAVREPYLPQTFERAKYPMEDTGSRLERHKPDAPDRKAVTYSELNPGGRNPRNWRIWHPEPFKGAHFATFPRDIPRFAILAGTADKVCSQCGTPWETETEREPMVIRRSSWGDDAGNRTATSGTMVSPPKSTVTGQHPACTCNADSIPATVLDPFSGSGTTQVVARELGRRSIYVDRNPEYAAMAMRRLEGTALNLFAETAATPAPPTQPALPLEVP